MTGFSEIREGCQRLSGSQLSDLSTHEAAHGVPSGGAGPRYFPASRLFSLAEDRGFEPLRAFTQHAFQACAIGH